MIVVDTSALMAVVLDETVAEVCGDVMARADVIAISAGTLAEALIVAGRRNVGSAMERLIRGLGCQVVPVTENDAFEVAEAYARWGRGVHPAGLNYGDCFAYALARQRACPLLFVGDDFTKTDIKLATWRGLSIRFYHVSVFAETLRFRFPSFNWYLEPMEQVAGSVGAEFVALSGSPPIIQVNQTITEAAGPVDDEPPPMQRDR